MDVTISSRSNSMSSLSTDSSSDQEKCQMSPDTAKETDVMPVDRSDTQELSLASDPIKQEEKQNMEQQPVQLPTEIEPVKKISGQVDDTSDTVCGKQVHNVIRRHANAKQWPAGPARVSELYEWASWNAEQLLSEANPVRMARMERLYQVAIRGIDITEAYAGSGAGGWSLHLQMKSFLQILTKCMPVPDSGGLSFAAVSNIDVSFATLFMVWFHQTSSDYQIIVLYSII